MVGTLSEFHSIHSDIGNLKKGNTEVDLQLEAEKGRLERELKDQEQRLFILKRKIEKSAKVLEKLKNASNLSDKDPDVEIISEEERLEPGWRRVMQRLGCYFCSDVVSPVDSTTNCTLDQQCTVTCLGLAPIASSLAVELLVGILHHPFQISAKTEFGGSGDSGGEQPLGILPHQIRASISQFSRMILVGHASTSFTACSSTVVSEYQKKGLDFILEAINHPTYLEDLTELMKSACSFKLDWDNETGDEDDFVEI